MTILDDLTPAELGLPPRFADFRQAQREMTEFGLYGANSNSVDPSASRRFIGIGAPAGSGKSLGSHAIGMLSGVKYAVLTATRTLEDQQTADGFPCVNVRGKANYQCRCNDDWTCEEGEEEDCRWCGTIQCPYTAQVKAASGGRAVLTNYQYWMHARANNRMALERKGERIQLLIVDEAHLAMTNLSRYLATWISNQSLHQWAPVESREALVSTKGAEWGRVSVEWTNALTAVQIRVIARMSDIAGTYQSEAAAHRGSREYRRLDKLNHSLSTVLAHGADGNWIWKLTKAGVAFECVWPGRYAERYLWSGVDRVVCMSATLRPKAMQLLGVRPDEYWFREWPRVFPAVNSPVYWVPTGRMGRKAGEEGLAASVARIDEIIAEWGHLKGIVHTPSYKLAEYYQAHSRYGRAMILNEGGGREKANDAAGKYRQCTTRPCVLVSPSFSTGWDFPADAEGAWQIIPKLPFADMTDPVVKARMTDDPEWYTYECMQQLVQACGRQTRTPTDKAVTFITDDLIKSFRFYGRSFSPKWWSVRDSKGVPGAPRL